MATMTIIDLPSSRALDYKALSAIRGSGTGDWVMGAPFVRYTTPVAAISPVVNFYQTNYIANNMTLETENVSVNNSASNALIVVAADQNNALTLTDSKGG
jgi:hypothetical protein